MIGEIMDFAKAALPWILMGISVAILAATQNLKRRSRKQEERLALGMALGLLLGVALNGIGLWESYGLGIALGPLCGMAIVALIPSSDKDEEDPEDPNAPEK